MAGDSLSADADAVPEIDPLAASEPPSGEDLAYDRTTLMDPAAARELAESADMIPEAPLEPAARGSRLFPRTCTKPCVKPASWSSPWIPGRRAGPTTC